MENPGWFTCITYLGLKLGKMVLEWPMTTTSLCIIHTAGIDVKEVEKCVGDPNADVENPILKAEQDAQVHWIPF